MQVERSFSISPPSWCKSSGLHSANRANATHRGEQWITVGRHRETSRQQTQQIGSKCAQNVAMCAAGYNFGRKGVYYSDGKKPVRLTICRNFPQICQQGDPAVTKVRDRGLEILPACMINKLYFRKLCIARDAASGCSKGNI